MTVSVSLMLESVTVYWPLLVGSAAAGSLAAMVTSAASSSAMVTVAALVAPIETSASPAVTVFSVTVTVSLSSMSESSTTVRSIVAAVFPARIVTAPASGVKSSPDVASPVTV